MLAVVHVRSQPTDGGQSIVLRIGLELCEVRYPLRPQRRVADVVNGVVGIPVVAIGIIRGGITFP